MKIITKRVAILLVITIILPLLSEFVHCHVPPAPTGNPPTTPTPSSPTPSTPTPTPTTPTPTGNPPTTPTPSTPTPSTPTPTPTTPTPSGNKPTNPVTKKAKEIIDVTATATSEIGDVARRVGQYASQGQTSIEGAGKNIASTVTGSPHKADGDGGGGGGGGIEAWYGISKRWKQLYGEDNWQNIMDPLDLDLRKTLIHYGEMCEVTYDAFNYHLGSKFAGDCKYPMNELFAKTGLVNGNPFKYQVTKYFYATSSTPVPNAFICKTVSREGWTSETNWLGYIAVATDEGKITLGRREIVIVWRGTAANLEWANDLDFTLVPASKILGDTYHPHIHHGWYSIYTSTDARSQFVKASARDQILGEVKRLVEQYKDEEISITVTGHSLGASLATLTAVDIAANGFNKPSTHPDKPCLVTAFVYASPRVGDIHFKTLVSSLKSLRIFRTSNVLDVVPKYPLLGIYLDVGVELVIDNTKSPYLSQPGNINTWHTCEAYIHGIAGTQGRRGGFKLEVKRDISLVNKLIHGVLKEEYHIPSKWWVEKNKGMVQQPDGSWILSQAGKCPV